MPTLPMLTLIKIFLIQETHQKIIRSTHHKSRISYFKKNTNIRTELYLPI